jgi:hypothetical protein
MIVAVTYRNSAVWKAILRDRKKGGPLANWRLKIAPPPVSLEPWIEEPPSTGTIIGMADAPATEAPTHAAKGS